MRASSSNIYTPAGNSERSERGFQRAEALWRGLGQSPKQEFEGGSPQWELEGKALEIFLRSKKVACEARNQPRSGSPQARKGVWGKRSFPHIALKAAQ